MRNRLATYSASSTGATFQALADPTRRAVLDLLRRGALPAGQIARQFPVSRPAISKHLRLLRRARLVEERRRETPAVPVERRAAEGCRRLAERVPEFLAKQPFPSEGLCGDRARETECALEKKRKQRIGGEKWQRRGSVLTQMRW